MSQDADDSVFIALARRARDEAVPLPAGTSPGADTYPALARRFWWRILETHPGRRMCEQWFDVAFGFVCRSYPQCRVRRDDFLQEAHLYIIGRLQERIGEDGILDLDSGPPFSRWVRRRLLNSCLNLARKESRRTAATSADPELVETVPARSDDDPYGIIEEQVAALHACIEALPAELRDVAGYVRDEPGITLTEIARRLDRSVATASNRYQQIITLLRHCLGRRGIT